MLCVAHVSRVFHTSPYSVTATQPYWVSSCNCANYPLDGAIYLTVRWLAGTQKSSRGRSTPSLPARLHRWKRRRRRRKKRTRRRKKRRLKRGEVKSSFHSGSLLIFFQNLYWIHKLSAAAEEPSSRGAPAPPPPQLPQHLTGWGFHRRRPQRNCWSLCVWRVRTIISGLIIPPKTPSARTWAGLEKAVRGGAPAGSSLPLRAGWANYSPGNHKWPVIAF